MHMMSLNSIKFITDELNGSVQFVTRYFANYPDLALKLLVQIDQWVSSYFASYLGLAWK